MKNSKNKLNINGKQITFRYNPNRLRFECNFGYRDNLGIRKSRLLRGKSVEELQTVVEDFAKQISSNDILNKTITLEKFFDFYINNVASAVNRSGTIRLKNIMFNRLPLELRQQPVTQITSSQLQLVFQQLSKKYVQNTIALMKEFLNTLFNQAISFKVITENPCRKCSVKSFVNGKKVYISPSKVMEYLDFLKSNPIEKYHCLYAPAMFIAFSGCRKSEALGLKKQFIDSKNNLITIAGQLKEDRTYTTLLKTKASYRTIKVPKEVIDIILSNCKDDSEYVFLNNRGKPFCPTHFGECIKTTSKEFGIEGLTPKQFRNSFVKTAVLNDVPLKVIQGIVGHSKLSTTADIYGELEQKDGYFVSDIFEQFLHK